MPRFRFGTQVDRFFGASRTRVDRDGRRFRASSLPGLQALEERRLLSDIVPSAVISSTPDGSNFDYKIDLSNSSASTDSIGTFWYAWIAEPFEDFLATKPVSVTMPTGWNETITNIGSSDGYAIEFTSSGAAYNVQPGSSMNFGFTSADTPASVNGDSVFYPGTPVGTSVVYSEGAFQGVSDQFVVAAAPTLQSITVTPANTSLPTGETEQFTATGTLSNNTTENLTNQVTWTSSDTTWATINSAGLATAVSPGPVTISAAFDGVTGSTALTVTAAALKSIAVTPANTSLPTGETEQFTATGTLSDNSTEDLTSQVTWTSSDTTWATINSAGLATAVSPGPVTISAAIDGITGSTKLTVTAAALKSIAVTPVNTTLPTGETEQFTATGTLSDNSTEDLTSQVTWTSSDTTWATITSAGLATAVSPGPVTISAAFDGITGSTALTITAATLKSIAVTPANTSLPTGETEQFTATGTLSDNSTENLTTQVTWTSSDTTWATINSVGLASAVSPGPVTISAAFDGITGSTKLTVTAATLKSIAVTPANTSLATGETEQFTATGTLSDNSTENLTTQVTWTSSDTTWATINSVGLASAVSPGPVTISAAFDGITGSTKLTVTAATLKSIAVTPANTSLATGETEQFTATGTLSDNSTEILTNQVTWTSSDTTWATINSAGLASAVSPGPVTITAAFDGITGSTKLTVTAASLKSIAVTPANTSLATGETEQFTATGTLSDNSTENLTSQVTWTSSDTTWATINSAGLASAVSPGPVTISAAFDGITGSTALTFTAATLKSIAVTPANTTLPTGETEQFTATGTLSDNSTENLSSQVTWTSSDTTWATINSAGLASAVSPGPVTISAALDGITGSTALTVTAATLTSISVTPANTTLATGKTEQFTATGTLSDGTTENLTNQATWTSSDTTWATINSAGLASAVAPGPVTISAAFDGFTGSTALTVSAATLKSIAVTPINTSLPTGETEQFTATGTLSDNSTENLTTQVTWTSSDTTWATINSAGLASAVSPGPVTISAAFDGVTGSTALTITAATLKSIAVTPANTNLPTGETEQFKATGTLSDNSTENLTTQVTWTSSDTTWATINSAGLATAVSPGPVTISAAFDGITGSTALTITAAALKSIAVTPANTSLPTGETEQFTATGTLSDNSTENLTSQVTWTSSDTTWATINSAGLATAVSPGPVTISAAFDGITGSTGLTVTAATLKSIAVTPANTSLATGETEQFTATGTLSDNSTENLTNQVTWTSSDTTWATINSAGLATAVSPGPVTISAALDGITGSTALTVTAATLKSIAVTPANTSLPTGETEQFTATGTLSDNSTENLTSQVTWTSSDTTWATINSAGLASAVSPGPVTISAAFDGVTGSTALTITAATLKSIAVTPPNTSLATGETEQFTATGTLSDNSTENLTNQVTWTSSDTTWATINSAGLATAVSPGPVTITAALDGITGSTALTVTAATLKSIAVTPPNTSLPTGETEQFTATGTLSDNSTENLTSQVTWTSSDTTWAAIDSAGLATAVSPGPVSISASFDGFTGSTALTISAAVLKSIAVTPTSPSIVVGTTQQFTATGTLTDGTTENLTESVSWTSSNVAVATISAGGLATGVGAGSSSITATAGTLSATISLAVINAATVSAVSVSWGTAGTVSLQTAADGLRLLPVGRTTDLPWFGINSIAITLSNSATLTSGDVTVTSAVGTNFGPVTISGSGTNFVITLAQPISTADRVTFTIANSTIATYTRRLDVLPGDVNDYGVVNLADGLLILRNDAAAHAYNVFYDLNGDGAANTADFNLYRPNIGTVLPTVVTPASTVANSAALVDAAIAAIAPEDFTQSAPATNTASAPIAGLTLTQKHSTLPKVTHKRRIQKREATRSAHAHARGPARRIDGERSAHPRD